MKKKLVNESLSSLSFLRVASLSLDIRLGDIEWNVHRILESIKELSSFGSSIITFQPLSIVGGSLANLFLDATLLKKAEEALSKLLEETKDFHSLIFLGLPLKHNGNLYSSIVAIYKGRILFIHPLRPSYYTYKAFSKYNGEPTYIRVGGKPYLFGDIDLNLSLQKHNVMLKISNGEPAFLCEKSYYGFFNLVFSDAPTHVGAVEKTISVYKTISSITKSVVVYVSPSTTENYGGLAYSNATGIFENGQILSAKPSFSYADIDLLLHFNNMAIDDKKVLEVDFKDESSPSFFDIARPISTHPYISFMPSTKDDLMHYASDIFKLQIKDIKNRCDSIGIDKVVLGLSGGLDSTLALLFLVASFKANNWLLSNIYALTLPCFGSTSHTKSNAVALCNLLCCNIDEIDIKNAVRVHFKDIGQNDNLHDVTYENAQARERTQVLMDRGNQLGALVIGSSDLSEIALGFSTFNGDHMSMYNVLGSIPKTLVRLCIEYAKDAPHLFLSSLEDVASFNKILQDILITPISPELLPPKNDEIVQKTEEILGSYELQDFFIHYVVNMHYDPKRTFLFALKAFPNYTPFSILKALKIFYKRFFISQFKRNCSPEHANITGLSFYNHSFPSNIQGNLYLKELEELEKEYLIEV